VLQSSCVSQTLYGCQHIYMDNVWMSHTLRDTEEDAVRLPYVRRTSVYIYLAHIIYIVLMSRRKIRANLLRARTQHLTHCIDVWRQISENLTQCRDVVGGDSRRYTSVEEILGDIPPFRISADTTDISALISVVSALIRNGGISPRISSTEVYLRESPPTTSRHCVRFSEICLHTSIQCVRCCVRARRRFARIFLRDINTMYMICARYMYTDVLRT
jgi:hypothetical protein